MRSAIWAFMALFGLLATLSVVQAAVPAIFSLNTNIGDATQADIAVDAFGNSYYLSYSQAADFNTIVPIHPDGSKFTGCTDPATLKTQFNAIVADLRPAGFTVVADRNFPASPSAASWLFITACNGAAPNVCKLIRVPLANVATATGANCPINWAGAADLGQVSGSFTSGGVTTNFNCARYASTVVAMASNPVTGALYIGCPSGGVSYVVQTSNMQVAAGVFQGTFASLSSAVYRIPSASAVIGSMAIDSYGSLWVVDTARSMVFAARPFTTVLDFPSSISSNVGLQSVWSRATSTNKYLSVAADRSGNIYLSTYQPASDNVNVWSGNVVTFPGIALINPPATSTVPRAWSYFSTGSTFDSASTDPAGGILAYDPYRGRLIMNGRMGWYNLPLYTVQFDFTTAPSTLLDGTGAVCGAESPTCIRVPVMTSNVASSFTLRIAAPSWPATVASLPFSPNFLISTSGVSANAASPFPTSITQAVFQNTGASAAATYAQIGTTGSFLFSWTTGVTVTSTGGYAGPMTLSPAYTGATNDVAFLFTSLPSTTIVVQGSITAVAQASATFPLSSSTTLLAGVPTRYQLTLNPAPSATCTTPTVTFTNSADNVYSLPPAAAPAAGANLVVSFTGVNALVTYVTNAVTQVTWSGAFGGVGTGCTVTFGAARVPLYAVAMTTTARPAILVSPINQLISSSPATPATFEVRMIPGPSATLAANMAVGFRSGVNPATATLSTSGACSGDFTPTSGAFSSGTCTTGVANCAVTGNAFTPNTATCALAASTSAAIVADVAIPAGLLATGNLNYWYWNAATGAPAQVPTTASTINVYTITAPLSVRMKWSQTVGSFPATQIVAPNAILGPYTIDYTGSPVSVSFTTPFGGSFFVLPAGTSVSNYPTAASAWSTGSFSVGTGSLVFYRAPAVASATMLGAAAFDITVVTPTGVTYDPTGTPVAIQIRLVSSLSTTSTPRNANLINLIPNSINIWAGTTVRTRNTVTLSWGSGLLNANNVITVYGTTDTVGSAISFAAVGAVPAVPGAAVTTNPVLAADNNNANIITNVCNPGACASVTFGSVAAPVAAGTSSVTFLVAGGKPGEKISFWLKVTGGDSAFFGFPFVPVAVNFGQVFINSLPTQLSVNVPTFFGVTVEPPAAAATNLVIADSSTGNVGTFQFCSDITCATNQPGATYNLVNMNGAYATTTTVIQYIPPFPQACVGGLANQYPCALGTIPTFTSDLDPTYAFDWAPTLVSRLNVQNNAGKFKLTVGGNPALQGSIAITFVNYDAANDATNPPIGVNTAATTFTYPLSNTAGMSALPLPMVNGKPSLNFLAGVRYAIGVTMYPAPDATASPTLTVAYNEDNLAAPITGSTFSLNRADATAPAPINGAPALNTTVNVFGASPLDFTNNRVDNALKALTPAVNAVDVMCPANSQVGGKCFVGFFWWNVPAVVSGPAANNPRLTFTVSGTGVANYPTQTQTVKISGWCGPSANLRDPLQPTHYATPTTISTQCTPALPAATFLNVFQDWKDLVTPSNPWSQPLFFPAATPFVAGTTTWTPPTANTPPAVAGAFVPVGTAGTWMQVFRAATENSALVVGMSNLVYSVTTANTATDRTTLVPTLSPSYVQIRHISPIVGAYTVKVANAAFAAGGCDIPAVGYIGDNPATRLPSVSATSNNFAQVCVFPPRAGNGPAFDVTVSDGLTVDTNTFVAAALVTGATSPVFAAGVSGPATQFPAGAAAGTPTKAGLTLQFAAGAIAYNGFNFNWNLANAATNIAEFRLCAAPAAGAEAAAYTAGVLNTICAPNAYPAFPAGTAALPAIQYRQVATTASSTAVTYAVNRVPISVTMKFTARGMGADFNLAGVSTFNYVVGETYAIELRTAASLSSPAVAGLTVTLNDLCGVLTYPGGGAAPTPAASPVAVPARGQFSSQVLFFSPGETTKTFWYTPREICAPVAGGAAWGTIITATVCTDANNAQCADGAATRFVNPTSVFVSTYGSIRIDNVPSYLPSGVATPSPITVTLNPPILPAGAVSPVISALSIPDLRVTLSDRAPAGGVIGNGDSAGGSFILGQNTGASATLNFATAGVRQSASVSYVAPPNAFFIDNAVVAGGVSYFGVSTGISAVVTGTGAPYYRIVGAPSNVYNGLATIAASASAALSATNKDLWAAPTASAATFNLRIVPEATAAASIEGVYFNVVAGAALAQSTSQSLATVSDNISQFVGNSNVQPGQANNAINFNLPFVSGVPFGYFAAVPFNMSAVVVNVATTANTIYVNNNGWPNAKSAGGSLGGYILPNALSGYVSPVFFLTPGLNTFLVAAPAGAVADAFAFGAPAGAATLNPGANGDGIVYRFTIARDTITNFGLFVSANGYGTLPWSANLPRLQPQYVAGSTASLLSVGPGSGAAQTVFTANVENGVQSVGIVAQFYGALKARVSSNLNEFGQVLVNIPNNRIVDFPLVAPTNLPGITSSTTSITLLGGGLGPITINVVRPGKSLIFGSQFFSAGTAIASNVVDTPTGPCVARTATSFGLAVYPSSRASSNGLTIKGTYATAQAPATAVPIAQAATSATTTWDIVPGVNYVSYATLTATAIPVSALPVTLNLRAVYAADAASEFTSLINYQLNLCPQ